MGEECFLNTKYTKYTKQKSGFSHHGCAFVSPKTRPVAISHLWLKGGL